LTLEAEADDEATLINLRYALADAIEFCRRLSGGAKSESTDIEQSLASAALQVMLLLRLQQKNLAAERELARLTANAA